MKSPLSGAFLLIMIRSVPIAIIDISNVDELLDKVAYIRELTGRPVGVKAAIGGWRFINESM